MKPTLLIAALTLVAGSPVAMAKSEVEILRARCNEQELQIRQLEKENAALRGAVDAPVARKSAAPSPSSTTTISTKNSSESIYVVKSGDSVERIARYAGTTPQTLAKLNGLTTNSIIHPGQKLKLPGASAVTKSQPVAAPAAAPATSTAPAPTASGKTHTVRLGETYYSISRKYGITVKDLTAANPTVKPTALRPGHTLNLAPGQSSTTMISAPASSTKATTTAAASTPAPSKPVAGPTPAPAPAPAAPDKPAAEPVSKKPRAITIDSEMTYGEFAKKHGTDANRLNDLNGLDLNAATILAKGSELYVPSPQ